MYGGLVSTNDKNFIKFAKKETENYKSFPKFKFFKQIVTFLILKIFAVNIFYKLFFLFIKVSTSKRHHIYKTISLSKSKI